MFQKKIYEIEHDLYSHSEIKDLLKKTSNLLIKGRERDVLIGQDFAVKVNANIGISDLKDEKHEIKKLEAISKEETRPDTLMDHTIVNFPLWKKMTKFFDGPIGALPHYTCFDPKKGIDDKKLIDRFYEMIDDRVSFFTIHPTANYHLLEMARMERKCPTTSRGGAIVLKDMQLNNKKRNVFDINYDEILSIAKNNDIILSIGSVFRPACNTQALDKVHIEETKYQLNFIEHALRHGVKTMMEGVGHITLSDINKYIKLKETHNVPFMPLGPIPTDRAFGMDHISSAIGASHMCINKGAQIINSITPEEHTCGVPSLESIILGIRTSRLVAQSVNICKFVKLKEQENESLKNDSMHHTFCIGDGDEIKGCTRCSFECPLTLIK